MNTDVGKVSLTSRVRCSCGEVRPVGEFRSEDGHKFQVAGVWCTSKYLFCTCDEVNPRLYYPGFGEDYLISHSSRAELVVEAEPAPVQ